MDGTQAGDASGRHESGWDASGRRKLYMRALLYSWYCVLWSVLYVVYVDGCLLALVTGVLELVYLQPLALRKNVHQSWPLALS